MHDLQQDKLPRKFGIARDGHITFAFSRWVYRANNFRELVEPFDIANYYRLELDRGSGHYLHGSNRPGTFKRLEEMWQQYNRTSATYKCSLAWADAMVANPRRPAPETPAPPAGTAVQRLDTPELVPPGTLPLVHRAL